MKKIVALVIVAVSLSGCGMVKERVSGYYLSKVRKTVSSRNPSQAELQQAFIYIGRSLKYAPDSRRALAALESLTEHTRKAGFAKGADLEIGLLKRVLRASPFNWPAHVMAVNTLSTRGDLFALNEIASRLESVGTSTDTLRLYETSAALALCYASMVPWVESEGYLNLNKDPDALIEKAREYARVRRRAEELHKALLAAEVSERGIKKKADTALLSSSEVALTDLEGSRAEAARVYAAVVKMDSEPDFLKALALTVRGNSDLLKKDYSRARALYQSALQNYPGFLDARKQLVEVDFQEGAGMALLGTDVKAGRQFLHRAYDESDAVIELALQEPGWLPFLTRDKFLADTYSIRAAVISALNAIEKSGLKNRKKLEREFKDALNEAVRLNPQGKLARDLLERYAKEGF